MRNYQADGLHQKITATTQAGLQIKAAAYVQSAEAEHPDHITFDMAGTVGNQGATVFGVFKGMSPDADRHDMRLWDFYVADSGYASRMAHGDVLTLPVLESSNAIKCSFDDLGEAICKFLAV